MASLLLSLVLLGCLSALSQAFHRGDLIFLADHTNSSVFILNATSGRETRIPLTSVYGVWDVDFDPFSRRVYWTDFTARTVSSARMDGHDRKVLVTLNTVRPSPYALAVDPFRRLVFYTRVDTNAIVVMATDGGDNRDVLQLPDEPLGLALDMVNEVVYYSVLSYKPQIGRVGYNGSHHQILVNSSLTYPQGLTLDLTAGRIYWCDYGGDKIDSSRLDGSDRTTVILRRSLHYVTLLGDTLIFSTDDSHTLHTVHTDGTHNGSLGKPVFGHIRGISSYSSLTFFPLAQKMASPNETAFQSGDAVFLADQLTNTLYEVSVTSGQERRVPTEHVLHVWDVDFDPVQQRIFWSDTIGNTISSIRQDGSDLKVVVKLDTQESVGTVSTLTPGALAVDPTRQLVFYSRSDTNVIAVVTTDGHDPHDVIHVRSPAGLALDVENETVYYTVSDFPPCVGRVSYNGSNQQTLVNTSVTSPFGIALDLSAGRMYWSDFDGGKIEGANMDGSDRRVVLEESNNAFAYLALLGNTLIFVENSSRCVLRTVTTDGSRLGVLGRPSFGHIMGVAVYRSHTISYSSTLSNSFTSSYSSTISYSSTSFSSSSSYPTQASATSSSSRATENSFLQSQGRGLGIGVAVGLAVSLVVAVLVWAVCSIRHRLRHRHDITSGDTVTIPRETSH